MPTLANRSSTPAAPDVSHLSAACTDRTSVDFDCTEGYGETWDYIEADECSECGAKLIAPHGEEQHHEIDASSACEGYVSGDGPMFNYVYPLDACPSDDEIREALADLSLCVVTMNGQYDDYAGNPKAYLALTGGGMNMAWYICTAYVRLGYLPPLAYCDLPNFAGMKLSAEKKRVLAACQKTAEIEGRFARRVGERLTELQTELERRAA